MLFPRLAAHDVRSDDGLALHFGDRRLTYAELADVAAGIVPALARANRVAVWATPSLETAVAVVAALFAGTAVVPLNPAIGERELAHILRDSEPELVLTAPGVDTPVALPRVEIAMTPAGLPLPTEPADDELPAFVVYTSGTTGPPKGVVHARRALGTNLDGVAAAWGWTGSDTVVHALPLFHVHGLILGVLGPLRRGGTVRHVGRFSVPAVAAELAGGAMMFGVPTMYSRLAAEVAGSPELASAVGRARLLVSGSAPLQVTVHRRIEQATGQWVVERYGLTETLMNTAVRASGNRVAGSVGPAIDGVEVRLVDDTGAVVHGQTEGEPQVGEVEVRGPNLFLGYLNRPDATEAAFRDGWFRTGDIGNWTPDGQLRIVGRRATDLIKSGGYKIGAGEIENVLADHPGVVEVAVTGEPDDDLGEKVVAWIVAGTPAPEPGELVDLVARQLAPHKRPRDVRFVDALPRNEMGKILKRQLGR